MKKLVCLVFVLGFLTLGVAQEIKRTPLQTMVETELAFARMSLDEGTRPSFMAFIADDGILFRPRAVKGKQWMIDHPLPASDKRPLLSWYPAVADMALAGDMGYTTGPWEFKSDIKDAKPAAFGNFLTVWKKQADGSWKFAIDLGISNPQPAEAIAPWKQSRDTKPSPKSADAQVETIPSILSAVDSEFAKESVTRGSQIAFTQFAAENVRVFRNNHQPFVGKTAALAALPESAHAWNWEPAFADVSQSGDLGYTYGTYRILKKDAAPTVVESGNYFRVWKKQGDKWLVVTDVLDPVKDEKPN